MSGVPDGTKTSADTHPNRFAPFEGSDFNADIWSFNTLTEQTKKIGTAAVGTQAYVASIDADPSRRYLYYVPGAHGGSERDARPWCNSISEVATRK